MWGTFAGLAALGQLWDLNDRLRAMDKCKHTGWLKFWDREAETGLDITDRPQRLLKEFGQPHQTHAGLLVLIGNQSKQQASRKLVFVKDEIRARANGEVHLLSGSLQDHATAFLGHSTCEAGDLACKPYDFVQVSRLQTPVAVDLACHVANFLRIFQSWNEIRDTAIPLIASSLLLDQFPPGMHYGGGIRGAAPLGFLKALQDEVGIEDYGIQRHFDVKFGTSSGGLSVLSLDILGWTVDDCMSHLKDFAAEAFTTKNRILNLVSKVPILSIASSFLVTLRSLLFDSKYSASGLERHLIATYGRDRGITDLSFASQIGAHVGVTLTRARDGAAYVATNYNGVGKRCKTSDYSHLPSSDPDSPVKWWEASRATTAAPSYYSAKRLGAHGTYQDGGLAFNNPASIAMREAIALTSDGAEPSLLLSLGTGSSSQLRKSWSMIFEMFPFRVYRALWQRVSSKTAWDSLVGHQLDSSQCKLFRLDVDFEHEQPSLDDVGKMDYVQHTAQMMGSHSPLLKTLARHLRAELFYFELDGTWPLPYSNGLYHCVGNIFCRLRASTVEHDSLMKKLRESGAMFRVGDQSANIDVRDNNNNLMIRVGFSVPSHEQVVNIKLCEENNSHCDISGSPFTVRWLMQRQSLNASFGTSDHRKRKASKECHPTNTKRRKIQP
ncbi:hypothetical protein FSARC_616 [Fusarium sarcochroum]|uniref:PNPLA domain-containing protein n=1 Tax=Fusarium sarcochroum TaxID=1208366 RepID=A0A8H4XF74_9HYPO|nr:hypothetical protein FSARC_616 [Fusarium sarcochroum]